ncbi:DUF1800 domain-containing protein [Oryzobacter sp. R7]|uniref:DUF1800 domain-containing protein n=1 Tax=Oryzobacter faecalis TaxID=3388656 RepID=UPI00398CAEBC
MSPAPLSRRSTAAALLASALDTVAPGAAGRAAMRAAAAPATAPAVDPAVPSTNAQVTGAPVRVRAPKAATVDRVYRPRVPLSEPRTSTASSWSRKVGIGRMTSGSSASTSAEAALHLARRASWGATPGLVAEIRAAGATAWVDAQLAPAGIADTEMDALLAAQWPRLSMAIWEVHDAYWPSSTGDLGNDLVQSYVARALWSRRQLLEVLVDFWTNHLVVTAPWGDAWDSAHRFHADVIRKHALGRYADMLVAAAKHPAMLEQLDNASSTKRAPNENFGREVLELHTVGHDGGYLESDILRSALVLTGMSVDDESGEYQYRHIRHHKGRIDILGFSHANDSAFGEAAGVAYLTHLARHPRTARRIATKLCVRFVADAPPAALVDRLAQVYLANDTRIAPVVRALLLSPEFAASTGQKTKRPLENLVSTARVLGARPGADTKDWLRELLWAARVAGQAPMAWPAPNGYPDVAGAWAGAGAVLACWNWHMSQGWEATSSTPEISYPALRTLLPATLPATYGGYVDALATRLLHAPLPATKRDAVCAFLDRTAATALKPTDPAVGWRLPYVVALVLDSPEFATR